MDTGKRCCYYILDSSVKEDGIYPVVVVENEAGYNLTDWNWGTDRVAAEDICTRLNTRLGWTAEDVNTIITSSMKLRA